MNVKQKLKQASVGLLLSAVTTVSAFVMVAAMPQVTHADTAPLTTWQKFIKDSCGGGTADAAARCASNHRDDLREECGRERNNQNYIRCWRGYIRDHGGTAGRNSSPFEEETPQTNLNNNNNSPGGCSSGLKTAIIPCVGIWGLIEITINILSVGVGLVAIGGIMYGGFLYATAGDKADQVTKGVHTIVNVVIGVVAYFLLWAFLQYLIPGGVFQ